MDAREKIAKKFGLRYEKTMQDWELEASDPNRINEFLVEFEISGDDIKSCLAELIMASFDDSINAGQFSSTAWEKYCQILSTDIERYREMLAYWSSEGEDVNDYFAVKLYIDQYLS